MLGVNQEKGTLSPSPAQGAASLQGLSSALKGPGAGGCPSAPLLPKDRAFWPGCPQPGRGGGAEPFGDTATAIQPNAAQTPMAAAGMGGTSGKEWGYGRGPQRRPHPASAGDVVAGVGPVLQAAIPYLPPRPADSERQAGRGPPAGFIPCEAGGESTALSACVCVVVPPPRTTVLGFLLQADGRTDTARARRRPPLLPPRAGSGPNSVLGSAGVNQPRPPWQRLGPAAAGMLRWGAGWDRGQRGGMQEDRGGLLEHPTGLEHHPELSKGAGQVSPPPPSASLQGWGGSGDEDAAPSAPLASRHGGSCWFMPQQRCGPGAGLDPRSPK